MPDQVQPEPAVANFARRQYQPPDALQNRVAPLRDILEVEVGDDLVEVCNRVLAARPCAVLQPADAVVHAAPRLGRRKVALQRSEEHTSELQSLTISQPAFCLS